jgi:CxxC-x17-CxxC domain-containing protein
MSNYNREDRGGRRDFRSGGGDFRRGGFGGRGGSDRGSRQMHKAVCDNCGKDCMLPFRPTGDKPVYCSECFENKSSAGADRSDRRDFARNDRGNRQPSFDNNRKDQSAEYTEEFKKLNNKLDSILRLLTPSVPAEAPQEKEIAEKIDAKVEKTEKKESVKKPKAEKIEKKSSTKKKTSKK